MVEHRNPFTVIFAEDFRRTSLQLQYMMMVAIVIAAVISFSKVLSLTLMYTGIYCCFAGLKYYKVYIPIKNMAFRKKGEISNNNVFTTEDYLLWVAWEAYTLYWTKHPDISEEYERSRLCAIIGISFGILA